MKFKFSILFVVLFCSMNGISTSIGTASDTIIIYQDCSIKRISSNTAPDYVEAVDLGLSVKWANVNIGATSPEEYGDYFAWGETSSKSYYDYDTYSLCNNSHSKLIKYNDNDGLRVLESIDDIATQKWGENWRLPTEAEMKELIEKCTWTWVEDNKHNGFQVTGPSKASIFLPAAGWYQKGILQSVGYYGHYWTSTVNSNYVVYALFLFFKGSSSHNIDKQYRSYGRSVRPIYK